MKKTEELHVEQLLSEFDWTIAESFDGWMLNNSITNDTQKIAFHDRIVISVLLNPTIHMHYLTNFIIVLTQVMHGQHDYIHFSCCDVFGE